VRGIHLIKHLTLATAVDHAPTGTSRVSQETVVRLHVRPIECAIMKYRRAFRKGCLLLGMLLSISIGASAGAPPQPQFDVVIVNGRVMDPETGLDAVRNIGIRDGKVVAVTQKQIHGRETIDAKGLVVAPGFIDLHQHSQTPEAYRVKAVDGVTTALEMEEGVPDIDRFYSEREGKALINFGATIGHEFLRAAVVNLTESKEEATGDAAHRALSAPEIEKVRTAVELGLHRGALGVGILMSYTPGATPYEVLEMFRAAAQFEGAPVHIHVRDMKEDEYWLETDEAIADSVISGAPVQIVHANSSYQEDAQKFLAIVDAAAHRGVDVTTEAYPYCASMTGIESVPEGWEKWPDARFHDLLWAATGEPMTRESFMEHKKTGGLIIIPHKNLTDAVLLAIIVNPRTMIASDGILKNGIGHPRVAGTYSRVLGHYVRETRALTLMEALRKMTLMPAQRLETRVPSMKDKGRIGIGHDADITIFNPETVIDRATYRDPALASVGIEYVLVNGVVVVRGEKLVENEYPGTGVRAPIN
jgi:N-acyl-D-aspartate/D-glutamate deacylase